MQEIIQLDKEAFIYLNTLGSTTWDWFWVFLSERTYWIPFYLFLLYLLFRNFGWKKTGVVLALTLLMVLFTDQITNLLKDGFQRPRPCFTPEFEGIMRGVGCERRGLYGFTSAHASNHIAIALFLGLVFRNTYKWMLPFLLIWAALISYSRIYLGVHFPLDVICGGMIGLILGFAYYRFYLYLTTKYAEKLEK
ncbi:phosphatase PAP2 family protein [Moheibacter lacus]|uniref:phosphatase PAP2 family protein n=1 Tax=Moheibacter lacus TaxID=2745851 RepID=UPI001C711542|nr:phosphatase PAP2 family protein [Moheibacter lacus]